MTRECKYEDKATEFSLWLRKQSEIDSKKGYTTHDIDFIWENYNDGLWMFLEEKRSMNDMTWAQKKQFKKIHNVVYSENYKGFHLIQFEKTDPDDGDIFLDGKRITKDDLFQFLQFKKDERWYSTTIFG